MKRILLFRHGKSSWTHPGLADADRPLLSKGEHRTKRVAQKLAELNLGTGLIVTSNAVRALRTAAIVAEILNISPESVVIDPLLYHASENEIWDIVYSLPDDVDEVMLFGHNPGLTDFANSSGITDIDWLPTSGVVTALFNCTSWHQCAETKPQDTILILPEKS